MDSSLKFNETEFTDDETVSGLPDVPSVRGMTAAQLKARFDNIGKVMIALGKHNALVDALSDPFDGASGIGATFEGVATTVQDALDSLYTQGMNTLYMIAEPFFPYDSYSAGDIVWYEGKLYLFTFDHTGEWDGADAEEISVSGMLQEQKGEISDLQTYAMQVKPYLADNTDLDTVRTNGVYPGHAAYTYSNRPADSSGAFWLYVSSVPSTGYTVQVFISLINGRVWIRNRGGAWTAWKNYLQSELDKFGLSVVNNQICITY